MGNLLQLAFKLIVFAVGSSHVSVKSSIPVLALLPEPEEPVNDNNSNSDYS